MRAAAKKQISSLGIILPYDYRIANPPKLLPVVFFSNKQGSELRATFEMDQFVIDNFKPNFPETCSELVFIQRNYDGSELYYYVCSLTYEEIEKLRHLVKDSKGGILL